jgi:hypothetical protein
VYSCKDFRHPSAFSIDEIFPSERHHHLTPNFAIREFERVTEKAASAEAALPQKKASDFRKSFVF